MAGFAPLKDQLCHNNMTFKVMFWAQSNPGVISLCGGEFQDEAGNCLITSNFDGFEVTPKGAVFIKANIHRDVLSHREVKLLKDMTAPPPPVRTLRGSLGAPVEVEPAFINPDPNLSIAGIF